MTLQTKTLTEKPLFLGIDIGTSGIRFVVLNTDKQIIYQDQQAMPFPEREKDKSQQDPEVWIKTINRLLERLASFPRTRLIKHIILDATSSSVLLCNDKGQPLTPALMYDDRRATAQATQIKTFAPKESAAHGASSTLSKVMYLESTLKSDQSTLICHQIDFIVAFFTGKLCVTDENNALKLGYDIENHQWPAWLKSKIHSQLPEALAPGTEISDTLDSFAQDYQLQAKVYAGTTDSIAAFLASGANQVGDVVSSLGSTLAIKFLTDKPIFEPEMGIYSHFINDMWLAGGASNAGGAVLLQHFELQEIISCLNKIDPNKSTGLNYYPLNSIGERFPISDSQKQPLIEPIPQDRCLFLQGLLEGLTEIELLGLEKLRALTNCNIKRVFTAGGGTKNPIWMAMRTEKFQQAFDAETKTAPNVDAAFGIAQFLVDRIEP